MRSRSLFRHIGVVFAAALLFAGCIEDAPSGPENPAGPEAGQQPEVVPHPLNANPPNRGDLSSSSVMALIDNGTVQLGVHPEGHLNVDGGTPSAEVGTTAVGVRYMPTNGDGTSPGCLCEGWGVADAGTAVSGYANEAAGTANITVEDFQSTASTATSIVTIGTTFRVTHVYQPSAATDNLYEVLVSIENISGSTLTDVRYRRAMDWDIAPNTFSEYVTIQGTEGAEDVLYASDNGFANSNPLGTPGFILFEGDAVDSGPADHGAVFDFGFGELAAGATREFTIFYGAAGTEAQANNALAQVGAEIYSYGQGNWDGTGEPFEFPTPTGTYSAETGEPHTFIFAFAGVGGMPQIDPPVADPNGPYTAGVDETIALDGSGSFSPDGRDLTYEWDFGDGSTGTGEMPTHAWSAPGTYTITLTVEDTEGLTGTATTTVTVGDVSGADLSIEKEAGVGTATVGVPFVFTLTVSNAGPDDAENVVVTDEVPSGLTLDDVVPSVGTCGESGGTITCELGTLASGATATIDVTVTASAAGAISNTATVASDTEDPNEENNSSTAELSAEDEPAELVCTVVDFNGAGAHGDEITSFDLDGQTISVSVDPNGGASLAAAVLYSTDTSMGPDPDLEWDGGECADCEGQGNALVISGDPFDTFGDSGTGGSFVMTGFPAGEWLLRSFTAIDSDEGANPYRAVVDGSGAGASSPGANGNVQQVSLEEVFIDGELRIELIDESGAIDDLEFCTAEG